MIIDIFKLRVQQVNEEYRKICDTLKRLEIEEYDLALALTSKQREIALLEQKLSRLEEEVIAKIQEGRKWYRESEESKQRRSEKLKGKKLTEETKLKMSQVRKGKVSKLRQPIKDNLGRVYTSLLDAANQLNLHTGNISNVLRGKARSTGGLTFTYIKTGEIEC